MNLRIIRKTFSIIITLILTIGLLDRKDKYSIDILIINNMIWSNKKQKKVIKECYLLDDLFY